MGEQAGLRDELIRWRSEIVFLLWELCAANGIDAKNLPLSDVCTLARTHGLLPPELLEDVNFVRVVTTTHVHQDYDKAMRRDVNRARACMARIREWLQQP